MYFIKAITIAVVAESCDYLYYCVADLLCPVQSHGVVFESFDSDRSIALLS